MNAEIYIFNDTLSRTALICYLSHTPKYRNASDQQLNEQAQYIEQDLFKIITSIGIDAHQSIYECTDKESLGSTLKEMLPGRLLHSVNEQSKGKLKEALKYYIGFLGSKYHPLSEKEKKGGKKKTHKKQTLTAMEKTSVVDAKTDITEPELYEKLEGRKHEVSVTRYERDRGNRKDCIAHYGYVCQVCGMNFEQIYGELGKDFIEVHHLHPVSQGECQVNPIEDLIPLCSNCHSMIHRQEDVSDWEGLRIIFLELKQK